MHGRIDRHQCGGRDPAGEGTGPGHTIVTVLCDYGTRYQSKLFNPEFLREKGLLVPHWLDQGAGGRAHSIRLREVGFVEDADIAD